MGPACCIQAALHDGAAQITTSPQVRTHIHIGQDRRGTSATSGGVHVTLSRPQKRQGLARLPAHEALTGGSPARLKSSELHLVIQCATSPPGRCALTSPPQPQTTPRLCPLLPLPESTNCSGAPSAQPPSLGGLAHDPHRLHRRLEGLRLLLVVVQTHRRPERDQRVKATAENQTAER